MEGNLYFTTVPSENECQLKSYGGIHRSHVYHHCHRTGVFPFGSFTARDSSGKLVVTAFRAAGILYGQSLILEQVNLAYRILHN
jgi:hypothetical protein